MALVAEPPFSMLTAVIRKILRDKAVAVVIMPHWKNQPFFQEVQPYIVRKHYYPKNTLMFETAEGGAGGTMWPVWAVLVDGSSDGRTSTSPDVNEFDPTFAPTSSSRRRWRRRFKALPLC